MSYSSAKGTMTPDNQLPQPLKDDALQQWDFYKQPDETYRIWLKSTGLLIITLSDQANPEFSSPSKIQRGRNGI